VSEARPFDERVQRMLAWANGEAAGLQHEYLGTEHLLLGLVHDRESIAVGVLQNLGVSPDDLGAQVHSILKRGDSDGGTLTQRPYTTRAKRVLELAARASESLGHQHIGTEHILLGLVEEAYGIGGQGLNAAGVTIDRARAETVRLLARPPS